MATMIRTGSPSDLDARRVAGRSGTSETVAHEDSSPRTNRAEIDAARYGEPPVIIRLPIVKEAVAADADLALIAEPLLELDSSDVMSPNRPGDGVPHDGSPLRPDSDQ